jgi:hypothetical protein
MQRTYLALASLTMAASLLAISPTHRGQAEGRDGVRSGDLFGARPVDSGRYAVLGRPLGQGEWTLLVLEQILPAPRCWQSRPDGLIDPSLNRFDFSGICGRYLDSNGYSLRLGNREGRANSAGPLRLRLQEVGSQLQLLASAPDLAHELVVGRGAIPGRDRDGLVALRLNPGWELQRRTYGAQVLNHVYFANPASADQLIAAAAVQRPDWRRMEGRPSYPPLMPPPPPAVPLRGSRSSWRQSSPPASLPLSLPTSPPTSAAILAPTPGAQGRVVALQVIPFRD